MFELIVALRFLKEGKMQTLLIIMGIAIGISVLIFLNALIGGLQQDLVNTTVGNSPHITARAKEEGLQRIIEDPVDGDIVRQEASPGRGQKPLGSYLVIKEQLESMQAFTAVSPATSGSGFASQGDESLPVVIKGLPLEDADTIYNISNRMVEGEFQVGRSIALLVKELAEDLRVAPGSIVRLSTPDGFQGQVTVSGTFDLGSAAVNSSWLVLSLEGGQTVLDLQGKVNAIEMQVDDVFAADGQARSLERSFPELSWVSWQEENADLLSALSSQSASSYLIQAFVLLAVTMGISSVLAVSAIQKSKQIGILKALGISTKRISRIFLLQGALLGLIGSLIGSASGSLLIYMFLTFVRDEAGEALFPVTLGVNVFIVAVLVATGAGMVAAAAPARRAAGLNVVEVIKNV